MIAILVAATVATLVSLLGTPLVIRYFRNRGFGQQIRDVGPESHLSKAGTPTMGGTAIVLAAVIGWLVAHLAGVRMTPAGLLAVATLVGMGAVGFADDFIKVRMQRNLGLSKTAKFGGQALIAVAFAIIGPTVADFPQNISVVGIAGIDLSTVAYLFWIFFLLSGWSNAVNLTDGLDGLAAGSSVLVFMAYLIITFWQFRHPGDYLLDAGSAQDLAVLTAAVMAACAGFLWHNAPPASIFMGDTGSLALGGLMAALSVLTNTQILLVVIGGLYVATTLSVVIQVFSFRVFGRRVFRMAPLHHHFELLGWAETTIIVRFWLLAGIGVGLGIGLFYAEFLQRVGTSG